MGIWLPKRAEQERAMHKARAQPGVDMKHIINTQGGPGWKQLTDEKTKLPVNVWEFLHEKGYGHVTKINGEFHWTANRGDRPADTGKRRTLEDARSAVTKVICG